MTVKTGLKGIFIGIVFLVMTVLALYVAGIVFMISNRLLPVNITPTSFYSFVYYYHDQLLYQKKLVFSAIAAVAICYGVPVVLFIVASREPRALHGAARFANKAEILQSGLLGSTGIIVGKYKKKYLMFPGQQFVLLSAATRSGKGVGIVIPNLLNYKDSVVVLDIKQENYKITSGYRAAHGQEVYLFNPFAEDLCSHRYNPLAYIRDNAHFRTGDILAIGKVLYPGSSNRDSFFDDQACNFFLGLTLYLCETPELPRTLGELLRQSSGKGRPIKDYLIALISSRAAAGRPLSDICVDALNRFTSTSDNTLASILASFNAPLTIFANPIVDAATSANDFDLREVRKTRMTLYLGITPDHLANAALLMNLLFSQLINLNTKQMPEDDPELKFTCLLLMDEFTSIGKVGIIASAVSYIAGYNLRLLPIIQSISQLESVYGREDARTFMTNHACQILFAPREQKDANEYSEMLGYETVKGKSTSWQRGTGRSGHSESQSDQKRALLLPQELKELGKLKEVIILENTKPILADKITYYNDPVFTARMMPPTPVPTLDLDLHTAIVESRKKIITLDQLEGGIDLSRLALNMDSLRTFSQQDNPPPEEISAFVDQFFQMIEH